MSSRFDKLNLFTRQSVKNAVRSQDPNQLVQATKNVHSLVDREIVAIHEQAAKDGVAPACQPGCSFCCHRLVAATLPEVIGIADYVSANFSVAEREELSLRAEASAQTNASFWRLDSQFATGACAFLNEGQCTIYEARPLSCRARNSTGANSCRDFFLEGRGEQKGVLDEQAGLAELNSSILNLCRDVGLASGLYELGPAVLELLDKSESANLERFKVFSEWTREQPAVHPVVAKSLEDPGKQEILKLRNADRIEEMWDRLDRYKGSSFASIFSHSTPPEFSSADDLELWWGSWGQALDQGNAESHGFTGTGLGDPHHVLALQGNGNGLILDLGRDRELQAFDDIQNGRRNTQPVKIVFLL